MFKAGHKDLRPVLLAVFLLGLAGCAARRARTFLPAGEAEVTRAVAAWTQAVARADSLPAARLLYEARLTQGPVRMPGTLAVKQSRHTVEASLTGPFGSPVATYSQGELHGRGIRPLFIAPKELRALLAGVWPEATPEVRGIGGEDALLVWEGDERVEGVLDLSRARFRSLSVSRREGKIVATYSGEFDPWPSRLEVRDAASGGRLKLALLAREPMDAER